MQTLIVVILHVATELLPERRDRREGPAVNQFRLERVEERFHVRVLVGRAAARHAVLGPALHQARMERRSKKLAAAITVKDQLRPRPATTQGRIQDAAGERRVARQAEPPGEQASGFAGPSLGRPRPRTGMPAALR